ncbi:MAG: nucleotidyltransferase family protein [Nitrososphaerales archaeon]
MKAVILAAGLGTRLRPYTLFLPKPMLPLGERPVLEYVLDWLKKFGFTDIYMCVGYLRRTIEEYFKDGSEFSVKINYIRTSRPMGTAGQLKSAAPFIDEAFLCVYGDTIFDFNLQDLVNKHKEKKADATIALKQYKVALKYGLIDVDADCFVKNWREKPEFGGLINIGCYFMEPKVFNYIPEGVVYSMDLAFQNMIKSGARIYGYVVEDGFIDIGDKKSYALAYRKYLERLGKIL